MEHEDKIQEIYQKSREELLKRELSNSENFDRAILTLSSAILALTVTYVSRIVNIATADAIWLLFSCWILFVVAIVSTIASFLSSQIAIRTRLEHDYEYYVKHDEEYLNKRIRAAQVTECATWVSAIAFVAAIILSVTFFSLNLNTKDPKMTDKESSDGRTEIDLPTHVKGGASLPTMQGVKPDQFGASVPPTQNVSQPGEDRGASVPKTQPAVPATTKGSDSGTSSGGGSDDNSQGKK